MEEVEYEPNILHILDELDRINRLIAANIFYILEEKDRKKLDKQRSLAKIAPNASSSEKSEKSNQLIADNTNNTSERATERIEPDHSLDTSPLENSERINKLITSNLPDSIKETIEEPLPNQPFGIPLWAIKKFEHLELWEELAELRYIIDAKIENSPKTKENLCLLKLKQLFILFPEEFDIFLICLIGEFDAHYQSMWGELQKDLNKKYPTIEIILNILSSNLAEKLQLKEYLQNESTLFKYYLLECTDNRFSLVGLTLNHTVRVSPGIINYLLGNDDIISFLSSALEFILPSKKIKDLYLPENLLEQIKSFASEYQTLSIAKNSSVITLRGKKGVEQEIIAETIRHMLEINMLIINMMDLLANPLKELHLILALIHREAILKNSAIYWQNTHLFGVAIVNRTVNDEQN